MNPTTALKKHQMAIRRLVTLYRTENPRVFGSVLHGNAQEGSDLDILVDTLPETTMFDLGGLQEELQNLLEVPVDLRTPLGLSERFRDHIISEARPI